MSLKPECTELKQHSEANGGFPAECFEYADDVTPEGVAKLRLRAEKKIAGKKWKLIEGFGDVVYS